MPHRITARRPRGARATATRITDGDRLESVLEDSAHVRGHADALVVPASEAEVAEALRTAVHILPIGAQSSLTGGATPSGGLVVSTSRMNRILQIDSDRVRVQAGVSLVELDAALAAAGRYYPPAPTFTGAFIGGTVSTNAAGAATFKYGTTRDWVDAITLVLPGGNVLDLVRGEVTAHPDGFFEVVLDDGRSVRVPIPTYRMPDVAKLSAGYYARPGMDLLDLFIGAEGTLGVVTEITLRVRPTRPSWCLAFVPFRDRRRGLQWVRKLRDDARAAWHSNDPAGLDVSAIEHLDARCLALARQDGLDKKTGLGWPDDTSLALIVTLELPSGFTSVQAYDEIGRALEPGAPDTALTRFCRRLDETGVLDDVQMAVPGDLARAAQIAALREGIPAAVNDRVGRAKAQIDGRIEKTAGDMIVPFPRLDEFVAACEEAFARAGLDWAIWGHISDGNLHPNVLPRSFEEMNAGRAALMEIARASIALGGAPLAEHGVGRSAIRQQMLELLYGRAGIDQMRAVKRALDPTWKLAPGVLFPPDA